VSARYPEVVRVTKELNKALSVVGVADSAEVSGSTFELLALHPLRRPRVRSDAVLNNLNH
jgi:hypothetical protein